MQDSEVHVFAQQLWNMRGQKAIAEAAHKAVEFEKQHNAEEAQRWRRIEAILMRIRGPHQS